MQKDFQFYGSGYLSVGAGVTYRPNDNLTVTLRPANARWTFVLDEDLQKAGTYGLKNDGDSSLFQFGFLGTSNVQAENYGEHNLTEYGFCILKLP